MTETSTDLRRKFFFPVVNTLKVSNGIGSGLNTFQYQYQNLVYSQKRRSILGFLNYSAKDLLNNKTDTYTFALENTKQITYPVSQKTDYYATCYHETNYNMVYKDLTNNRYIPYSNDTILDKLNNTKTITTTTLNLSGRVATTNTKTYNACNDPVNNWLHSQTHTYTWQIFTLNGNQTKTIPIRILTTQQFKNDGLFADTVTCNYSAAGRLNWKRQGNKDGSITTSYGNYTPAGVYQQKTVSAAGCTARTENYTYDATQRFVLTLTNPLNHITMFSYNLSTGNKTSETDANGLTTAYQYDGFGNLKKITFPDGTKTETSIDWNTNSAILNAKYYTLTTSNGTSDLKIYYDLLGREVCRLDEDSYSDTRYNANGQVEQTSYPYRNIQTPDCSKIWNECWYDIFGRKDVENTPYTFFSYTYTNRKITVRDEMRKISSYKDYDAMGRITESEDPGGLITYRYMVVNMNNKIRHRTTISINGVTTLTESDLWGNHTTITDPDAEQITSEYNGFNELTKQTDARGNVTTYQYDLLGRVTQKGCSGSGGSPITLNYTYDNANLFNKGKGKLYQIKINNAVSETFQYNNLGRLSEHTKKIDNSNFSFHYSYNSIGQLQSLSYPGSFSVNYSYTPTGKLHEIRRNSDNSLIYQVMNRNEYQQPTLCIYGNDPKKQVVTEYTYNKFGLLTGINTGEIHVVPYDLGTVIIEEEMPRGKNSDILNYKYAYNDRGLMISRSDNTVNQAEVYIYDNLDRLIKTKYDAGMPETITYANNGNITNKSQVGSYTYDSKKPHAVTQIAPRNDKVISADECAVAYNYFNQPTQISEGDYLLTLSYGADQQRNKTVLKREKDTLNTRYYASKYYEKEINSDGIAKHYHYIYGANGIVALHTSIMTPDTAIVDTIAINLQPDIKIVLMDSMYYIHTDHLGSYCAITNTKGKVVQRNWFDPWGNFELQIADSTAIDDPPTSDRGIILTGLSFPITARGFTGHEHYPYFKIINMNGRLYDPVIARFFSPDKYVANSSFTQDFNRYSYCRNNPLSYTDPSGDKITGFDVWNAIMLPIFAPIRALNEGMQWVSDKMNNMQQPGGYFNRSYLMGFTEPGSQITGGCPANIVPYGHPLYVSQTPLPSCVGLLRNSKDEWYDIERDMLDKPYAKWGSYGEMGGSSGGNNLFLDETIPPGDCPTINGELAVLKGSPNYAKYGPNLRNGGRDSHYGLDYGGEVGDPVFAMYDGKVTKVGYSHDFGPHHVRVSSHIGDYTYNVDYGHLSSASVVKGQPVSAGDLIGLMGREGIGFKKFPQAPTHVHIQIWRYVNIQGTNYNGYVQPSWRPRSHTIPWQYRLYY